MARITPLQTLLASARGRVLPLPAKLQRLYGGFRMAPARSTPQVLSNFVSTLDGVVSLQVKGHAAGGDISGFSAQDRMVMGLLRAVADVVIVGSGTLQADPRTVWTPEAICPDLAGDYQRLRAALGKHEPALNVVVSASGNIDLRSPVFAHRHDARGRQAFARTQAVRFRRNSHRWPQRRRNCTGRHPRRSHAVEFRQPYPGGGRPAAVGIVLRKTPG